MRYDPRFMLKILERLEERSGEDKFYLDFEGYRYRLLQYHLGLLKSEELIEATEQYGYHMNMSYPDPEMHKYLGPHYEVKWLTLRGGKFLEELRSGKSKPLGIDFLEP